VVLNRVCGNQRVNMLVLGHSGVATGDA
jgi:hypothetical protein